MQKSISSCTWRVATFLCKISLGISISKKHLLNQNAQSPGKGMKCYSEVLFLALLCPLQWICRSDFLLMCILCHQCLATDIRLVFLVCLLLNIPHSWINEWSAWIFLLPKEHDWISEETWSLSWAASGSRLKGSFFVVFVSLWPFNFSGWGNPVSLKNQTLQFIVKHVFPRGGYVECCVPY